MRLSELKPGESGIITKILGHGAFRKRVIEMGFVKEREIKVLLQAPLSDPIKYSIMGYEVSLRRSEASLIEVANPQEWIKGASGKAHTDTHEGKPEQRVRHDKVINVALIGNPNCGKTSLFNVVSGGHEHVGNYAGVTVGAKEGSMHYKGYKFNIVDLPGTYSLSAYSPEELYVLRYLRKETPDVIVNVIVGSNLERNLFLTTELIDMNRSMVIDLNMYDEVRKSGKKFDYKLLGRMLGVPVVPTVASTGKGIHDLLDKIIDVYEMRDPDVRHIHVRMSPVVEEAIMELKDALKNSHTIQQHFSPRYLAIKLLEGDPEVDRILKSYPEYREWIAVRDKGAEKIERQLGEDAQAAIASEKYGFIEGALTECMEGNLRREEKVTSIIDAFVTNKLFGFPIFILAMWFMFWCTFVIGAYPMEWIESLVSFISGLIGSGMHNGPLKDLLLDGIIGGVGGVIVFLPNILILYAFISFMEDSGYMARVAFIMDKLMHKMGLHGKSFIPLVMGFGCNVPAIMSTRIIESKSSRLITILINPFMSCSARIPIYVLLAGAFFPIHGTWIIFSLYILGIVIAVVTARLLRKLWFKKDETPFVMELPPYRVPTAKATVRAMWSKAEQYLKKMGGLILVASIIIWALSYFPQHTFEEIPTSYIEQARQELPENPDRSREETNEMILKAYNQNHSYLGRIGNFFEPVVKPFGQDWKGCVSLVAGSAAKEVVVSTLGVLYVGDDDEAALSKRLQSPSPLTGEAPFNEAKAFAFMIFVLLYFPCIATISAIIRETGSWKYGVFSVLYNTGLAWLLATLTYQIAILL